MFEKEAEEYLKAQCKKRKEEYVIRMPEVYIADIPQAFKDGAEFGYKEGIKTLDDMTRAFNREHKKYTDLRITNEWHYVIDGDLPKVFDKPYLCKVYSHFEIGYFTAYKDQPWHFDEYYLDNEDIIAWKEIVLPELKESE